MARISTLPASEWREDLRDMIGADSATLVEQGILRVFAHNPDLAKGVNMVDGKITYEAVAQAFGMTYTPLREML